MGLGPLLASVELGSSRNPPKQWDLVISRGDRRVIVASFKRSDAHNLADKLNQLFTDRPGHFGSCEHCHMPLTQLPTGRRARYCSNVCRQAAWKLRHPPARIATEFDIAQEPKPDEPAQAPGDHSPESAQNGHFRRRT